MFNNGRHNSQILLNSQLISSQLSHLILLHTTHQVQPDQCLYRSKFVFPTLIDEGKHTQSLFHLPICVAIFRALRTCIPRSFCTPTVLKSQPFTVYTVYCLIFMSQNALSPTCLDQVPPATTLPNSPTDRCHSVSFYNLLCYLLFRQCHVQSNVHLLISPLTLPPKCPSLPAYYAELCQI